MGIQKKKRKRYIPKPKADTELVFVGRLRKPGEVLEDNGLHLTISSIISAVAARERDLTRVGMMVYLTDVEPGMIKCDLKIDLTCRRLTAPQEPAASPAAVPDAQPGPQ
jgi:hypothetical protein